MAARFGVRLVLGFRHSVVLRHSSDIFMSRVTSAVYLRRLCNSNNKSNDLKLSVNRENESLLDNLNILGVDVTKARKRQPGVLRRVSTNEQGLAKFLESKGASGSDIASIISRYPRAITRSIQNIDQRWQLWRDIFKTDAEIVSIVTRSPESFFRSSDNEKLKQNIAFLISLGLNNTHLYRLLATAPRTFTNSLELNKQMVELLHDICIENGGENPVQFAKTILSKNLYILIRSTRRVKKNISFLGSSLTLSDPELLALIEGPGARLLDVSNEYIATNFDILKQKFISLGCQQADIRKLIIHYPSLLTIHSAMLNSKVDRFLQRGVTVEQLLNKPKILQYNIETMMGRLDTLEKLGYDFKKNGISLLDYSQKRFKGKIAQLAA